MCWCRCTQETVCFRAVATGQGRYPFDTPSGGRWEIVFNLPVVNRATRLRPMRPLSIYTHVHSVRRTQNRTHVLVELFTGYTRCLELLVPGSHPIMAWQHHHCPSNLDSKPVHACVVLFTRYRSSQLVWRWPSCT